MSYQGFDRNDKSGITICNPSFRTVEILCLFCLTSTQAGNTLEGDVSDVIALDQLTSPFSPRKATKMSP